eukprot:TRINITY_DN3540_c0_g1_i4.p1 TRINITY_DN3540_c0_g1~~TRINITY_DN3540_c0_g1_i4.p1  ORF type:complete len:152 (+),score=29.17 TRINITY_DN3540_c0_g1_i4:353-808(+)
MDAVVLLEIGHRRFQATRELLCKMDYFKELGESIPLTVKLDRDPQFFGPIIAFLRKGRFAVDVEDLEPAAKITLFEDILFFGIPGLHYLIEDDMKAKPEEKKDDSEIKSDAPSGVEAGVTLTGKGCFLCGTTDHDESECKFNPENAAGVTS